MEWRKLLSTKRLGNESISGNSSDGRTRFQRDFDRVVFSSAFRRLQDKTQVHPLPETDFVHSRLTHSLETSSIGRSLGKIIGDRLVTKSPLKYQEVNITAYDFGAIVAAACLAHDIGNPPFGHSGEDAIQDYFKSTEGAKFINDLTDEQKEDFQNFEGNASGFRLLTNTHETQSRLPGGLGLTYATLGAFTKYPKESLPSKPANKEVPASEEKFGFFQTEKRTFEKVAKELGLKKSKVENLKWSRHPLAYLVEAADDICYHIIDLEDGYKLRLIPFEKLEELLFVGSFQESDHQRYKQITDKREKAAFLRAKAINKLIFEVVDVFMDNEPDIIDGKFESTLIKKIKSSTQYKEIKKVSKEEIYRHTPVLEIEAAGFEIIGGLLSAFLNAVINRKTAREQKVFSLIPKQYIVDSSEKYLQIMNIVEFVSSMTDSYAITLYRKLKGISIPGYLG